jgi:PadR family transcriptional regulator, regulatory protein PadR
MEPLSRITEATVAVLEVLSQSDEPCWGLLIIKSSGKPAGSVYPILDRLESAGWVTSSWEDDATRSGPRRRYYELTQGGASAAAAAIRRVRSAPASSIAVVTP